MEEAFGVDAETLRASLAAYMSSVAGTEAKIANAIWFRDDGTFEPDAGFLADCASFAGAEAFAGEFTDALAGEINGWVSEHTEGIIDAIVDEIDPDAVMYLVNALSFVADWQEQYEEYQMRPGVFHTENGELEVTMMRSEERSYISGEGFTGFMKPYEGGRYAFAALLPGRGQQPGGHARLADGRGARRRAGGRGEPQRHHGHARVQRGDGP